MSGKKRSGVESTTPPTRGVRKLKQFLGNEAMTLARSKTAVDLVPTLFSSSPLKGKKRKLEENISPPPLLLSEKQESSTESPPHSHVVLDKVIAHLQSCAAAATATTAGSGSAPRVLSQSQCKAIQFLCSDVTAELAPLVSPSSSSSISGAGEKVKNASSGSEGDRILVKRVVLPGERQEEKMFDLIAVAALQRAAVITEWKKSGGTSSSFLSPAGNGNSSSSSQHHHNSQRDEQQRGRCIFVLASTNDQAKALKEYLCSRCRLEVVLADSRDAPSFPTLPASLLKTTGSGSGEKQDNATTNSRKTHAKRKGSRLHTPSSSLSSPSSLATSMLPMGKDTEAGVLSSQTSSPASFSWTPAPVIIASPDGFLATDPRSAVWRFVGAFVILANLSSPGSHIVGCSSKTIPTVLLDDTAATRCTSTMTMFTTRAVRLSQHRWGCLGHTSRTVVLASSEEVATHPMLDWLTSVKPSAEVIRASKGEKSASSKPVSDHSPVGSSNGDDTSPLASISSPVLRAPVQVRYVALEGLQRVQFLYALIQGLPPGRGMVVRVATREMCVFLFDVLYGFLDQLPPFLRLLADHQESGMSLCSTESQRLCDAFDGIVEEGRCSPVLFTCFGLVPRRGKIWLQFDVIEDIINYSQFLATCVTPGAVIMPSPAPVSESSMSPAPVLGPCSSPPTKAKKSVKEGNTKEEEEEPTSTTIGHRVAPAAKVEAVHRTVSRKRSRSPVPLFQKTDNSPSPTPPPPSSSFSSSPPSSLLSSQNDLEKSESSAGLTTSTSAAPPANYSFLFILFRPAEVKAALQHLSVTGVRHALEYVPFAKPPSLNRFIFVAEKIRTFHRKLFHIQNAAYHAYKATMTVYCTLKPRDVYDEKKLELRNVAAEFGYEEQLPLLDLRLADTPFRPKEDYWKASRMKAEKDRRATRAFAEAFIEGEGPVPLGAFEEGDE